MGDKKARFGKWRPSTFQFQPVWQTNILVYPICFPFDIRRLIISRQTVW
jgi:hypothetical protein